MTFRYIFLNKMSASVLYFVFVAIWSESIDSAEDRVRFVADINSLVGLMTLGMFIAHVCLRHICRGVGGVSQLEFGFLRIVCRKWLARRIGCEFAMAERIWGRV